MRTRREMLRDESAVQRQPIVSLNAVDRPNNIFAGAGRSKAAIVGFVKAQRFQMTPQTLLEYGFTRRNANDGFAVLTHHFLINARVSLGTSSLY
jgi:hypothetical protein